MQYCTYITRTAFSCRYFFSPPLLSTRATGVISCLCLTRMDTVHDNDYECNLLPVRWSVHTVDVFACPPFVWINRENKSWGRNNPILLKWLWFIYRDHEEKIPRRSKSDATRNLSQLFHQTSFSTLRHMLSVKFVAFHTYSIYMPYAF
jgi:hypothetical protein